MITTLQKRQQMVNYEVFSKFLNHNSLIFNLAKQIRKLVQIPSSSESIPDNIQYLLIGGGTASFSAFRAIKSADPTARVK